MYDIFSKLEDAFIVLGSNLGLNELFYIFGGLFLATIVFVLILTARAYESKLIKAIDMFNNYFIDHAQINEENLVAFNAKMKSKKVPKQLRKQWQQFVLYREHNASHYMSFDICVSNPIRNSSFKADILVMNIIAYISAILSLVLGLFCQYVETSANPFLVVFQNALITPVIILLLNYLMTIFLNLRHNAIVSDLYQNYQYFEVNIDKATQTLPDYVDYEVLFDKNEIKKGIPILYAYLQKRAEEEQRELERARLKNIEHEKFSFDDAGVAGSLVLERAMQEAENYIAERKKYNQDTEQINTDITQEDMNYREITKEYNRQMQVSKESFANYKSQLEEASSSIEANYLKKQQQQELDRQRNLEREFDTATERHKKVIESYQEELDSVDKFRAESRKNLESAMMSEFSSYSSKVYDEAKKVAEQRQQDKVNKLKQNIKELEERLIDKDQELEKIYAKHQELTEALEQNGTLDDIQDAIEQNRYDSNAQNYDYDEPQDSGEEPLEYLPEEYEEPVEEFNYQPVEEEYYEDSQQPIQENPIQEEPAQFDEFEDMTFNYEPIPEDESNEEVQEPIQDIDEEPITFNYEPDEEIVEDEEKSEDADTVEEVVESNDQEPTKEEEIDNTPNYVNPYAFKFNYDVLDEDQDDAKEETVEDSTNSEEESKTLGENVEQKPKRKAGRPRKVVKPEDVKPKRRVGRPKKKAEPSEEKLKRKAGRPKKVVAEVVTEEPKRKVGRPKKVETTEVQPKRKAGRPKKVVAEQAPETPKKRVGRPKKVVSEETTEQPKRKVGRPKKETQSAPKRKVGRPKKIDLPEEHVDIDQYLREIDEAIANENAVIEKARKELEKKAKIKTKK